MICDTLYNSDRYRIGSANTRYIKHVKLDLLAGNIGGLLRSKFPELLQILRKINLKILLFNIRYGLLFDFVPTAYFLLD